MLTIIAAVGDNSELGYNNDLIWHFKEDMKFFRSKTTEHRIIMGRKTFDSLNGLLPKRKHVVLTTSADWAFEGVEVAHSSAEILSKYKDSPEENFIIGGAQIYSMFLPYADRMYLTRVHSTCEKADAFFPQFSDSDWKIETISSFEENDIVCEIKKYERASI